MSRADLSFYQIQAEGVLILVQAQPGAKKTEFQGISGEGFLKIRLNAPAIEGKANKALLDFLSENLRLRKSELEIVSGEFARKKKIYIKTNAPEQILTRLKTLFS